VKRAEDVAFCTLVFKTELIATAVIRMVDTHQRDQEKSADSHSATETTIKNVVLAGETLFSKQVNIIALQSNLRIWFWSKYYINNMIFLGLKK
jgi:hypothetical protein